MRNDNSLLAVIVVALIVTFSYDAARADIAPTNNKMIKECLTAFNYDYDAPVDKRLNNFNWNKASNCVSNFNIEAQQKKVAAQREFLKKNPWFKGTNWKWQQKAEYTCVKQHHTGYTVCSKPYYIN